MLAIDSTRARAAAAVRTVALVVPLAAALGGCAGPAARAPVPEPAGATAPETAPPVGTEIATADSPDLANGDAAVLAPALDADRDRVADGLDDCPDSAPDEIVDEVGCPLFSRVLDGVVFAPGDHRLGAESRLALAGLVDDLEAHPDVVLRLEGHTDNRGTAAANLELSKRRVMSVARFLVARGIAPERLEPYGFGESRPRAGNATAPGRERNRRIEIERVNDTEPPAEALVEPGAARQNAEWPGNPS